MWNSVQRNDCWHDVDPQLNGALRNARARVRESSVLNRLMLDALPLRREVPIFQVDLSRSNHVISKDIIVVHCLNDKRSAAWKSPLKLEALVNFRVRLVLLIVTTFVIDLVST